MTQSLESEFAPGAAASGPGPEAAPAVPPISAESAPAPGIGPAAGAPAAAAGADGAEAAPAALADLVAAGLVSHEVIGDPVRLGGEAETLRALCRHVPGTVWRIEPYHYAFRLAAAAGEAPDALAAALESRLGAELGAEAVWVSATDLLAGDLAGEEGGTDLDAPLLLLRASAEAVAEGLSFAGPEVQAIVSAGFATRAARIAADRMEAGAAGARGEAEAEVARRLAAIEAGLAAEAEARAQAAAAEARLSELLAKVLRRLDAQADVLHGHIAREDRVAERLGEIAALAAAPGASAAAFQETLGLALAEFLARLERDAAPGQGAARVPQVS